MQNNSINNVELNGYETHHFGMLEVLSVKAWLLLLLSQLDQLSIQTHHDNITSVTTKEVDGRFFGMGDDHQHH